MTDKDTSRARKRTYNKISDVQRSKLQEYYDGGMKTCGSDNTEKNWSGSRGNWADY